MRLMMQNSITKCSKKLLIYCIYSTDLHHIGKMLAVKLPNFCTTSKKKMSRENLLQLLCRFASKVKNIMLQMFEKFAQDQRKE